MTQGALRAIRSAGEDSAQPAQRIVADGSKAMPRRSIQLLMRGRFGPISTITSLTAKNRPTHRKAVSRKAIETLGHAASLDSDTSYSSRTLDHEDPDQFRTCLNTDFSPLQQPHGFRLSRGDPHDPLESFIGLSGFFSLFGKVATQGASFIWSAAMAPFTIRWVIRCVSSCTAHPADPLTLHIGGPSLTHNTHRMLTSPYIASEL